MLSKLQIPLTKSQLEQFFSVWTLLATVVVLIVWALPHTIAARNIALYTGAVAVLGWLWAARPQLAWADFWPTLCLMAVPLWVLVHWYFISELRQQQWQELTSTWPRVLASLALGTGAGLIINRRPKALGWIILAIALLPTATFAQYLYQIYLQNHWILPSGMFYAMYKGKFSAVYFVLCQVLLGFGLLYFALKEPHKTRPITLLGATLLILIGVGDFIAARALNGIIVTATAFFACIVALVLSRFKVSPKQQSLKRHLQFGISLVTVLALLGSGFFLFWSYDRLQEGKLSHLLGDIKVSSKIDQNQSWARDGRPLPHPTDQNGRPVNGSTYERVSWFIKGVRLIKENPLGNGVSHMAFGYFMRYQHPNSMAQMTHSAWVDFALGLGLPGLILTWAAVFGVMRLSLASQKMQIRGVGQNTSSTGLKSQAFTPIADVTLWLVVGMFCFWVLGEVSEREYIEHYFFLIALSVAALSPTAIKPKKST